MKEINSAYQEGDTTKSIRAAWDSEKSFKNIVLKEFLSKDSYKEVRREINSLKFTRDVIRTSHSFSVGKVPESLSELAKSKDFLGFIKDITGIKLGNIKEAKILSLGWKDYTVLNDKFLEKPGVDLIFDFTEDFEESFGGQVVYVDGTGDYTSIPSENNSFIFAKREKGTQKFLKYINHLSDNKKRILVIFSF